MAPMAGHGRSWSSPARCSPRATSRRSPRRASPVTSTSSRRTSQILPALAPHLFPDNFNRRASARRPLEMPIALRAGDVVAGAVTVNVGRGGVAIRTMQPLAEASVVDLTFRLPGDGRGRSRHRARRVGRPRADGRGAVRGAAGRRGSRDRGAYGVTPRPPASSRRLLAVTSSDAPVSARMAIQSVATPAAARTTNASLRPSAMPMFDADVGQRRAREAERERQPLDLIGHQRDVGGLERDVGAGDAHRDADVGRGERRRVVDAVADHGDGAVLPRAARRRPRPCRRAADPPCDLVDAGAGRAPPRPLAGVSPVSSTTRSMPSARSPATASRTRRAQIRPRGQSRRAACRRGRRARRAAALLRLPRRARAATACTAAAPRTDDGCRRSPAPRRRSPRRRDPGSARNASPGAIASPREARVRHDRAADRMLGSRLERGGHREHAVVRDCRRRRARRSR